MPEIQNFRRCVQETHASWLMDSGLFSTKPSAERRRRAEDEVRRMGYELQIVSVTLGPPENGRMSVRVELKNHGVAPFYYDWPVEFGLAAGGTLKKRFPGSGKIRGLLPGDPPRQWEDLLDLRGVVPGTYRLILRIPNPLTKGQPLRFANKSQDADLDGWLTLGELRVTKPKKS